MKEKIIAILSKSVWLSDKNIALDYLADEIEKLFQETYLNDCIEKATPNLSKIQDVDKELVEIKGEKKFPTDKDIAIELIARYSGSSRGREIAKKAFIDGVFWVENWKPIKTE